VATIAQGVGAARGRTSSVSGAAVYALAVLTLANVLNYLDRQVVSILAQSIKQDLQLDDAQLGFLLGTAFAVFYSVVGIAMGRVADGLSRKKVMAFGLALWSLMTALGGRATSFATLGFARIGVGVGEAVANPCGHALVAEMFPPRNRSVAMAILMSGVFIGGTFAMFIGGLFLTKYPHFCAAVPLAGACGLAPWKAALIAVSLPGLPMALLLLAIREPKQARPAAGSALMLVLREIATALPPFTMATLARIGGRQALVSNLAIAAAIAVLAAILLYVTGDKAQWAAFGLGAYAIITWGQIQKYRDRPLYALTFGDPTFALATIACALIACVGGAAAVWAAPYAMRTFTSIPAQQIGLTLGLTQIAGSLIGVLLGGVVADRWKRRDKRAPMWICAIALLGTVPCVLLMLAAKDFHMFLGAIFLLGIFSGMWSPGGAAMVQDLVLPRMRGSSAACYSLVAIVVSSGTGPYWAGKVSTLTGSLTAGLLSTLPIAPLALIAIWLCARRLALESPETRRLRAAAAGEPTELLP
jgi:MFS family permease